MHFLITNDDGINAPGIAGLADEFANFGKVTVIAPEFEQSGVSHALTFLQPIMATKLESHREGVTKFLVNGTPSDCTRLGILELCDSTPDVVISGINGGLNVGINCLYSGTLGGAREGAFFGIPSFAVSLEVAQKGVSVSGHIKQSASIARQLVLSFLEQRSESEQVLYNINFPIAAVEQDHEGGPSVGDGLDIVTVPMETRRFIYEFEKGIDPAGRPYYWTKHVPSYFDGPNNTDVTAVEKGLISLTPMTYDQTDFSQIENVDRFVRNKEFNVVGD